MGTKCKKLDLPHMSKITKKHIAQIMDECGMKIGNKKVAEIVRNYSPDHIEAASGVIDQIKAQAMLLKYGPLVPFDEDKERDV